MPVAVSLAKFEMSFTVIIRVFNNLEEIARQKIKENGRNDRYNAEAPASSGEIDMQLPEGQSCSQDETVTDTSKKTPSEFNG